MQPTNASIVGRQDHTSGLQGCAFGVPAWSDFGVPKGCEVSDLALGESVLLSTPAL